MGQRVFLGVALAEIARGIYANGRKGGGGSIRRRHNRSLGCWREGELAHGRIWIDLFGMQGIRHRVRAAAAA